MPQRFANAAVLAIPCCRADAGWADAETLQLINIMPTHWRGWQVALESTL